MASVSIKWFFAQVDRFIYSLISIVYRLIEQLANIDVFGNEAISDFTTRIYTVLGVFMLFKISFSFINYIINPDKFSDKQTGFSKIIGNIILVFIMLITVPWAFTLLKDFQNAILSENIIGNFILGTDETTTDNYYREIKWSPDCEGNIITNSTGNYLSLMVFRPFYQHSSGFTPSEENPSVLCELSSVNGYTTVSSILKPSVYLKGEETGETVAGALESLVSPAVGLTIDYQVNYMFLISTIVGILICGLMISFALDVAVRSIKMGFLQIIAPIPIISFIDPDKSKHKMFTNWLQEVGKTWLALFIRIGALYLIVYILELLNMSPLSYNPLWVWITIFIIIGALIFAKKLPSLIEAITGLKLEGGMFEFNPLKKIKNEALGGKFISNGASAVGGALVGLGASAAAHGIAWNANRKKLGVEQEKYDKLKPNRMNIMQQQRAVLDAKKAEIAKLNNLNALKAQNDHDKIVAARNGDVGLLNSLGVTGAHLDGQINQAKQNIANSSAEFDNLKSQYKKEHLEAAEQKKKVDEVKNAKINSQPFMSAAGEIARGTIAGAKNAYKADTLNIGKVIGAGLKGHDEAALKRNYREDFSLGEELYDKMTTFARIKNESGTSSEISKAIKELNNNLTRERNNMVTISNTLANLSQGLSNAKQPEAINIINNMKHEDFINSYSDFNDYYRKNSGTKLSQDDFDAIYAAINAAVKSQKQIDDYEKNIKKYTEMKESQDKKGRE